MIVTTKILELMRKGIRNISFNDKELKLIGRGGEGNVYSFDEDSNIAIKVYREDSICYSDPDAFEKEMMVVRFLKDIDQIRDHIADVLNYVPCDEKNKVGGYVFMELYDGDLDEWAKTATTKGSVVDEDSWISMIFQIAYAFTDLNSRGVLHADPKPKNIFYTTHNLKDPNTDGFRSYIIEGKSYKIVYNTRFVLGDFSRVRIAEVDPDFAPLLPGQSGTTDLYFDLANKADLYELSRLLFRVMVNSVLKTFPREKIVNLVEMYSHNDPIFLERISNTETDIENMNLPDKLKDRMRIRLHAYELIEAGYISQDMMREFDPELVLPSKKIQNLLEEVGDPNKSFESIFKFLEQ